MAEVKATDSEPKFPTLRTNAPILLELIHLGCCPRCVLRFSGIRDMTLYTQPEAEVLKLLSADIPCELTSFKTSSQACVSCLGVLQLRCGGFQEPEALLTAVAEQAKAAGYEVDDYHIGMHVSAGVDIRQFGLWHHLRSKFKDLTKSGLLSHASPATVTADLREVARALIEPSLAKAFPGAKPLVASQVKVTVLFEGQDSLNEYNLVATLLKKQLTEAGAPTWRQEQRALTALSRRSLLNALPQISQQAYEKYGFCPPSLPTSHSSSSGSASSPAPQQQQHEHLLGMEVQVRREPFLLCGNYCKYDRELSQTTWLLEGKRLVTSSVEEEIARPILKHFGTQDFKFHSSGREDVDVRMLGTGRPFVLELTNCKRVVRDPARVLELQNTINSSTSLIEVLGLRVADKQAFDEMKASTNTKRKAYRCVVWVSKPLSGPEALEPLVSLRELDIQQQTPMRVLHRRSQLKRKRTIHSLALFEYINPHAFILDLTTQSGTYIKEFVHGDRGRTVPSVGSILGCQADILQLDVTGLL